MKAKPIRQILLVIVVLLIHGCCIDESDTYEQLTSDDLSHLYFDRDTVVCEEEDIEFTDSATFLLNSKDTIIVAAKTRIWSTIDNSLGLGYYANGKSRLIFEKRTGFYFAEIQIFRQFSFNPSIKTFRVSMVKEDPYHYFSKKVDEHVAGPLILDTALILGAEYDNVYKFELPIMGNESNIKSVYFAKKYGFIKIEGHDGSKLELIEVKSKGVKETY